MRDPYVLVSNPVRTLPGRHDHTILVKYSWKSQPLFKVGLPVGGLVGAAANADMLDVRRRAVMRDHRMRREECVIGRRF